MISLAVAGLLQANRLFHGDLVERVHRHLDVGRFDARSVSLGADLDVVIDHPLYRDEDLHLSPPTLFIFIIFDIFDARAGPPSSRSVDHIPVRERSRA